MERYIIRNHNLLHYFYEARYLFQPITTSSKIFQTLSTKRYNSDGFSVSEQSLAVMKNIIKMSLIPLL